MKFTIESREGLAIRGNIDAPRNAHELVVIVHGFKGFKDWGFFPWAAETLCDQGAAVCRFNMSRSGIGDDPENFDRLDLFADDTYSVQIDDLLRVVHYCQARLDLPTFLLGHSRGGAIALLAASRVENLCGIVTWSAIARIDRWDPATKAAWRRNGFLDVVNARTGQNMRMSTRILDDYEANKYQLDIIAAVAQLEVPLLVVHGACDESVPVSESLELVQAAPDASRVVIGTATHTYNAIHPLVTVTPELRLAAAVSARFFGVYS